MTCYEFCQKHGLRMDMPTESWIAADFKFLSRAYEESYLGNCPNTRSLTWVLKHFKRIILGFYKKRSEMPEVYLNENSEINLPPCFITDENSINEEDL